MSCAVARELNYDPPFEPDGQDSHVRIAYSLRTQGSCVLRGERHFREHLHVQDPVAIIQAPRFDRDDPPYLHTLSRLHPSLARNCVDVYVAYPEAANVYPPPLTGSAGY
jgi:hypothetical protein